MITFPLEQWQWIPRDISVIDTFKPPALTVTPELKYILLLLFSFSFIPFYCQDMPSTSPSSWSSLTWRLQQRFHEQGRTSGLFLKNFGQSCRSHHPSDGHWGRASGFTQDPESPSQGWALRSLTGAEPLDFPRFQNHHPSDCPKECHRCEASGFTQHPEPPPR